MEKKTLYTIQSFKNGKWIFVFCTEDKKELSIKLYEYNVCESKIVHRTKRVVIRVR